MIAACKEARWHVIPLTVLRHDGVRISPVCTIDFLLLEHLAQGFDTGDALQSNARIIVDLEVDAHAHPCSLHDGEDVLNRVALGVF